MKSSGNKIIIKPRRIAKAVSSDAEATEEEVSAETDQGEDDDNAELDAASEHQSESQKNDDYGDEQDDNDEGGPSAVATLRGRGRGRGRGSGRARGRPRGSGRGRARGRGGRGGPMVLLRLPRPDGSEDVSAQEGDESQGATPGMDETVVEVAEPIGGGKPFRRIQGKVYVIDNDEFVTDDDPKGDTKIDANGNLLGGRRFKAQTFALPNRHPERQYLLAIDAARTSGFRDSLYYFRRNPLAFKLNATQPEKEYLIQAGKLGSHLRTRSVTLITARSAYKLHGAKMIVDGRWVEDDYFEERALEETTSKGFKAGDLVGDLPEPNFYSSEAAALAAASGKSGGNIQSKAERAALYRPGGQTTIFGGSGYGPYSDGPLNAVRKSMLNRDGLTEENWMFVAAQRTMEASQQWTQGRKEALKVCGGILSEGAKRGVEEGVMEGIKRRKTDEDHLPLGVYEPHSGLVHYRLDTQPTRSRWEALPDSSERKRVLGGTKAGNGAWALAWVDTVMELPDSQDVDGVDEAAKERWKLLQSLQPS